MYFDHPNVQNVYKGASNDSLPFLGCTVSSKENAHCKQKHPVLKLNLWYFTSTFVILYNPMYASLVRSNSFCSIYSCLALSNMHCSLHAHFVLLLYITLQIRLFFLSFIMPLPSILLLLNFEFNMITFIFFSFEVFVH